MPENYWEAPKDQAAPAAEERLLPNCPHCTSRNCVPSTNPDYPGEIAFECKSCSWVWSMKIPAEYFTEERQNELIANGVRLLKDGIEVAPKEVKHVLGQVRRDEIAKRVAACGPAPVIGPSREKTGIEKLRELREYWIDRASKTHVATDIPKSPQCVLESLAIIRELTVLIRALEKDEQQLSCSGDHTQCPGCSSNFISATHDPLADHVNYRCNVCKLTWKMKT